MQFMMGMFFCVCRNSSKSPFPSTPLRDRKGDRLVIIGDIFWVISSRAEKDVVRRMASVFWSDCGRFSVIFIASTPLSDRIFSCFSVLFLSRV